MQLAGITSSRPGPLLGIQYKDIKITLLPDPKDGEAPRRLIEISFKHTKGYLGEKESYVSCSSVPSSMACLIERLIMN